MTAAHRYFWLSVIVAIYVVGIEADICLQGGSTTDIDRRRSMVVGKTCPPRAWFCSGRRS